MAYGTNKLQIGAWTALLALISAVVCPAQQAADQKAKGEPQFDQPDRPAVGESNNATNTNQGERRSDAEHANADDETEYRGHERGSLGVLLSESDRHGVRVREVIPGSPAARAGLEAGDRIRRIDQQNINSYRDLVRVLNRKNPNDQVTIQYDRQGRQNEAQIALQPREQVFSRGNQYANEPYRGRDESDGQDSWNQRNGRRDWSNQDRFDQYGNDPYGGNDQYGRNEQYQARNERWNDRFARRRFGWQSGDRTPMLGITVNAGHNGRLEVESVYPGGPADRAGIRQGDELLSIEGRRVQSQPQILEELRQFQPGRRVSLEVAHNGQRERLNATLLSRDEIVHAGPASAEEDQYGRMIEGDSEDRRGMNENRSGWQNGGSNRRWSNDYAGHEPALGVAIAGGESGRGVFVAEVFENGPASHAGLRPGDEIVAIDGQQIGSAQHLAREIERHRPHQPVELMIERDGRQRSFRVPLAERREIPEEAFDEDQGEQSRFGGQGGYDRNRSNDREDSRGAQSL